MSTVYYSVRIAVIRQDFNYIRFRAVMSTPNRVEASKYFVWMQKYLGCHALVRLVEVVDRQDCVLGSTIEINIPNEPYAIPKERKWLSNDNRIKTIKEHEQELVEAA